jgi:hypothetical protein
MIDIALIARGKALLCARVPISEVMRDVFATVVILIFISFLQFINRQLVTFYSLLFIPGLSDNKSVS